MHDTQKDMMREEHWTNQDSFTEAQETTLRTLCESFYVPYSAEHYRPVFAYPPDWVAGYVGGIVARYDLDTPHIAVGPEGELRS